MKLFLTRRLGLQCEWDVKSTVAHFMDKPRPRVFWKVQSA